jgi:DNA recombination-dependent growth factor C
LGEKTDEGATRFIQRHVSCGAVVKILAINLQQANSFVLLDQLNSFVFRCGIDDQNLIRLN